MTPSSRLPAKGHPIWKILHGLIAVAGIGILALHGVDGGHSGHLPDAEDGAGLLGLGAAGKLFYDYLRS